MFEPQTISIGPVFLPLSLITLVVLIFASTWLAERCSPVKQQVKGTVSDWLPTLLLIVLLVYKFGPSLFNLKQVFQTPALLLYGSGSTASTALGLVLAGSWMGWKVVKSPRAWEVADVIVVSGLLTAVAYHALFKDYGATMTGWWGWGGGEYRYHPLNIYRLILLLPPLIWALTKWKQLQGGKLFGFIMIWTGVVYTLTSFFDNQTGRLFIGLTNEQWMGILLAIIGFIVTIIKDRKCEG